MSQSNADIECNIIIIDDEEEHRRLLAENLAEAYGYAIQSFADLVSFQKCVKHGPFPNHKEGRPLVLLLDLMMAVELGKGMTAAPRLTTEVIQAGSYDARKYRDDELGLHIAEEVRRGSYAPAVAIDTPILFFTARQNKDVITRAKGEHMQPCCYLEKPKRVRAVHEAIQMLVRHAAVARGA